MNLYRNNNSWVFLTKEVFNLECGCTYYSFSGKDLYGYALYISKVEGEPKNKKRCIWFSKGKFNSKKYIMTPETILFVEFLTIRDFVGVKIEDWSDKLFMKSNYSDADYHNLFHDKPDKPFCVTPDKLALLIDNNSRTNKIILNYKNGNYAVTTNGERALSSYFCESIESAMKYVLYRKEKEKTKNGL